MEHAELVDEILSRGVIEIIDKEHLLKALQSKKKLRVKLGIDPTSPNIHIGRAVVLWKLRAFQELGHKVIFIVGDFTGLIGDTSDKDSERPMLTEAQVKENLKTYFSQAFKILDKSKTETHYNSSWLKKLGFMEISLLANQFGLHEFEARENISKRLKEGKRVSLRELMYPLMQGYDSVAVKADVELGGTDQKFNLLAGRTIQKHYNQEPQDVVMTELLEGTDGRKMSSSWDNVVTITDEPNNMFGKIMSVPDSLIKKYFLLTTRVPLPVIEQIIVKNKNPRDQKIVLAQAITELYHGIKKADAAQEAFIHQFSNKELPSDIPQKKMKPGVYELPELLVNLGLAETKSEVRRLIEQNGIKINQEVIKDVSITHTGSEILIQVGKRKFIKLI